MYLIERLKDLTRRFFGKEKTEPTETVPETNVAQARQAPPKIDDADAWCTVMNPKYGQRDAKTGLPAARFDPLKKYDPRGDEMIDIPIARETPKPGVPSGTVFGVGEPKPGEMLSVYSAGSSVDAREKGVLKGEEMRKRKSGSGRQNLGTGEVVACEAYVS